MKTTDLTNMLSLFTAANQGRPTRIGILKPGHKGTDDLWLESGLPLTEVEYEDSTVPSIHISAEGLRHQSVEPVSVSWVFTRDEMGDGLDVSCSDGTVTILRFEDIDRT